MCCWLSNGLPVDPVAGERCSQAEAHLADIERLDAEIATMPQRITSAIADTGTALVELHGVGPVVAAMILGHVADIHRFRTRAQYANTADPRPRRDTRSEQNARAERRRRMFIAERAEHADHH